MVQLSIGSDFGFEPDSEEMEAATDLRGTAFKALPTSSWLKSDGPRATERDATAAFARLGWIELVAIEQTGLAHGSVLGLACSAAEALGYLGAPVAFAASVAMPATIFRLCGESEARNSVFDQFVSGQVVCGVVIEPSPDTVSPLTAESLREGGFRLSGQTGWVLPATADLYIVSFSHEGEQFIGYVGAKASGLVVEPVDLADGTEASYLRFDEVVIEDACVLARGKAVAEVEASVREAGLMTTAAQLVGTSRRALELTVEYAVTRIQFGQTIGSCQVVQHQIVKMWLHALLASATVDASLRTLAAEETPVRERSRRVSAAKARASLSARSVCDSAVQAHGAIGFTAEHELGRYVNRSLVLSAWLGNSRHHTDLMNSFKGPVTVL